MSTLDKLLMVGNPALDRICEEVRRDEIATLEPVVRDLHDVLMDFRATYGAGRAIAAPQIGVAKRLVYMNIDSEVVMFNPVIFDKSEEMMEVWDDCMCFPTLLVKVRRHRRCKIRFRDREWSEQVIELDGDLSELLQHECDHLDATLAIHRAIDLKSFAWRTELLRLK